MIEDSATGAEIFVRFTATGYHNWPAAPEHRKYLRDEHRHLFHVEVRTHVRHDDRELEFHDLTDEARGLFARLGSGNGLLDAMSCEAAARAIATELAERHKRAFTVLVSEDGEAGASVYILPLFVE